eukprot:CAMPEP_0178464316 /NCGR_PEP_ID=MMETSP0689_2-20121128/50778_1 /TAXON_ID=160604 /ORGANISM="Amphidinium massartii, Strain CS-259" /LENGTH=33 /DNA_ID= /DNA_START= /DNA_END= /DNA_ORIENTATION=
MPLSSTLGMRQPNQLGTMCINIVLFWEMELCPL